MKTKLWLLTGTLALGASGLSATGAEGIRFEPYTFEARSGEKVAAEKGVFEVPENRAKPGSRVLKLSFVRFAATGPNKGAPIVYLAGGPGGSGVDAARGRRFPLFMALREVADVIALDQRGTGWSNDIPPCEVPMDNGANTRTTRDLIVAATRKAVAECAVFWRERGIDLAGYNTNESAADIEELRRLLGAKKVSLWGISYGSHLALATLKRYPTRIERAALSSIEGLDETVKLPAGTDAFFGRLQKAIDADPSVAKIYPDIVGTMRRVHARLTEKPVTVAVKDDAGNEHSVTFGAFELQWLVASSISDPGRSASIPALYALMDGGDFTQAATLIYRVMRSAPTTRFQGMELAMDVASGISPARARLVAGQAKTSLLSDALNYPMPHIDGVLGVPDLGEAFRRPVKSDVPTLFLSGTLDGRTYPESAAQIASRFSRATRVTVVNGGHNLFEADPAIAEVVVAFMKGQPVTSPTLTLPPPKFLH
jgi:pimeloyl-ACP methyl ester carboxylesterase